MFAEADWNRVFEPKTIAIIMTMLVPIAGSAAWAWFRINKTRSDNALKRSLAERGLGADEIERILAAKGPSDD